MSFLDNIKFNAHGLVPVVVQDFATNEVLMLAYMNKEALEKTIKTNKMHYFSRSRQQLWLKGETSGNFQILKQLKYDCDKDTILAIVKQQGVACHTGNYSCFHENNDIVYNNEFDDIEVYNYKILEELYNVISNRKMHPKEGSYTNYLFDKGIDKILKKVGEETTEVVIASKNDDKNEMIYEISDLIYHLNVLMVNSDIQWHDIYSELNKRTSKK